MKQYEKPQISLKDERKVLNLDLTAQEYINLTLKSLRAGLTNAAELLKAFIADLTGPGESKGKDAEQFAERWYESKFWPLIDSVLPWRYHLYNYDLDPVLLLEHPELMEAAYETYVEECRIRNVAPESWDKVLETNRAILQEEQAEQKCDQESLIAYIERISAQERKADEVRM